MMTVTHGTTSDGRLQLDLIDTLRTIPEQLAWALDRLDGRKHFAYSLWRLPPGLHADGPIDYESWPDEYIQVAGTASAMTIELRTERDSRWQQFTVGRHAARKLFLRPKQMTIRWQKNSITVLENQVFDSLEAATIFLHYLEHGNVPDGYELRPVSS
jgi:hypothetical protein